MFHLRFLALCLLLTSTLGALAQKEKSDPRRWEKDIQAFEMADKTNPPPSHAVLFIGSSSVKRWTNVASAFPEHKIINRGFGGSHLSDSAFYFDRIVAPYKPRVVVLFAGSNDINAGKTPEAVFDAFKEFVAKARKALPETRIVYVSITTSPSRWAQVEQVRAANKLIEDFVQTDSHLSYVNLLPLLLNKEGEPRPELYAKDRLHPNEQGYAIWIEALRPYLK